MTKELSPSEVQPVLFISKSKFAFLVVGLWLLLLQLFLIPLIMQDDSWMALCVAMMLIGVISVYPSAFTVRANRQQTKPVKKPSRIPLVLRIPFFVFSLALGCIAGYFIGRMIGIFTVMIIPPELHRLAAASVVPAISAGIALLYMLMTYRYWPIYHR